MRQVLLVELYMVHESASGLRRLRQWRYGDGYREDGELFHDEWKFIGKRHPKEMGGGMEVPLSKSI